MKRVSVCILICLPLVLSAVACAQVPVSPATPPAKLSTPSRELFNESMQLLDADFSTDPKGEHFVYQHADQAVTSHYAVRESVWYAFGLLSRDAPGDRKRAEEILETSLTQQYLVKEDKWYGTFRRAPDEALPPKSSVWGHQYDPNWREFIGTTYALILMDYPERVPTALKEKLYHSMDVAVAGESKEGRLKPSYTNIALMFGFLQDFTADHAHDAARRAQADAWTKAVYELYKQHKSFNEYNSPTYYGTDLWGLALWRRYGTTADIRRMGSEMEATMWGDVADFYSPLLHNIAGPYDRAYGMDMESYVSVMGIWMRSILPREISPLPAIAMSTDHIGDIWMAPGITELGAQVPAEALAKLKTFAGPHLVTRQIDDNRSATAWIGKDVIYGAEVTGGTRNAEPGPHLQFTPAVAQWRSPSGKVSWVRMIGGTKIDAVATPDALTIHSVGPITLIVCDATVAPKLGASPWMLPGMKVGIDSPGRTFTEAPGNAHPAITNCVDETYTASDKALVLHFDPQK